MAPQVRTDRRLNKRDFYYEDLTNKVCDTWSAIPTAFTNFSYEWIVFSKVITNLTNNIWLTNVLLINEIIQLIL